MGEKSLIQLPQVRGAVEQADMLHRNWLYASIVTYSEVFSPQVSVGKAEGWLTGSQGDVLFKNYVTTPQVVFLTNNATNYTYINSAGSLTNSTSPPTGNFMLLGVARVDDNDITWSWINSPSRQSPLFDAIVALDGTGDYEDPKAAFDAGARHVFVKNGNYPISGHLTVPSWGSLIGQSQGGTVFDLQNSTSNRIRSTGTVGNLDDYSGGGTIAVTDGSNTVTGTGTTFQSAGTPVQRDDHIILYGAAWRVLNVVSDTQITLYEPYTGKTASGIAFPTYVIGTFNEGVTFANFTVANGNSTFATGFPAIEFHMCVSSTMRDITLGSESPGRFFGCWGCTARNITSRDNGGDFGLYATTLCEVRDSTIAGGETVGLWSLTTGGWRTLQNSFTDCKIEGGDKTFGILSSGCEETKIDGCEVHDVGNISGFGILVSGELTTCLINNCRVWGNRSAGIYCLTSKVRVLGCEVFSNGAEGILLATGVNNTYVMDNIIRDNVTDGISIAGGIDGVTLKGNVVNNNGGYGLNLVSLSQTNTRVIGNTLYSNTSGAVNGIPTGTGMVIRLNHGILELWTDHETFVAPKASGTAPIPQQATDFDITSGIIQPDTPRNVTIVFAGGWDGGNVEVTGIDARGRARVATFSSLTPTPTGVIPWATISRIRNLGTRTVGTFAITYHTALGLVNTRIGTVYKARQGGLNGAVGTVNSINGTIIPSLLPNGLTDYEFWYTYQVENIPQQ